MKRIFNRLKEFDFKRMIKMIKVVSKRSGHSFIHVFLDIFRCFINYGSGYMDYYLFYFETLTDDEKSTYINQAVNKNYIRHCNNPKFYNDLNDKPTFLEKYKKFINRDFLDLRKASYEEYVSFVDKHPEFIVKPIDGLCGYGVELLDTKDKDIKVIYDKLNFNHQQLLEERIVQHPLINKIYEKSINTIRIVTLIKDGNVSVLFRAMRIGNNNKVVDNFNNGGLMAVVEEDGTIIKPVLDKDNKVYTKHPMTNTNIVGFKIPRFKEIIELCKNLAKVTPELGLCGWDIAVTDKGLDVVEGNHIPGYDIYQSREQIAPSRCGIKQKFDDAIFPEKKNEIKFANGFNVVKIAWIFFLGLVVEYVLFKIHINIPIAINLIFPYILLYKHLDTYSFKRIIITLLLIGVACSFVVSYSFHIVIKLVINIVISLVLGLLNLYFVLPILNKMIEKVNKYVGIVLTFIFSFVDLFFISTLIFVVISMLFMR